MTSDRTVAVADVPIRFAASDPSRQRAVDAAIRCLPASSAAPVFTVTFGADPPTRPDRPFDHADGDVRAWWEDDDLVLGHGPFSGRVTSTAAVLGGEGNVVRGFRQLLPYVLTHLLTGRERFVVHAGAVERDGRAALVLGASGSGKSSLVVGASRGGWRVLADDLAVIRPGVQPEVCGIAKPVAAPGDVVVAAGLAGRPLDGDARGRWLVADEPSPGWFPVGATFVATLGADGTPSIAPLTSSELVEWLLFSFLAARQPARLRRFLPVAAAVTCHRGWTFLHSRPPAAGVAAIGPLLADAVGRG